jgi:hypoxanthine phosphoribosyltransferase
MMNIKVKDKEFVLFIDKNQIAERVAHMADRINHDYTDRNPLFVAVLNGSFMFASDLMKSLQVPAEITFIKLNSYHKTHSTGKVKELIGLDENIFGRNLIIIEDIVDTGLTMKHMLEELQELGPKSIEIATFLHKPDATVEDLNLRYVGFEIPNKFVVGYGLDYDGQGRNLNDIYSLAN